MFYQPVSCAVVDSSEVKVLWNFNIYTDHVLSVQRPDIVL